MRRGRRFRATHPPKYSLKLMLVETVTSNLDVETVDIKSAFLQGIPLNSRDVYVKPPPEAKVPAGHVWKLKISLYGLQNASLCFHWKVREIMGKLGLKQSKYDHAVFIEKDKKGNPRKYRITRRRLSVGRRQGLEAGGDKEDQ